MLRHLSCRWRCQTQCLINGIICCLVLLTNKVQCCHPGATPGTAAVAATSCASCSSDSLAMVSELDARLYALLPNAILATVPTNRGSITADGCTALTPTCLEGEVVVLRVVQTTGVVIYENYDTGTVTIVCNTQNQWIEGAGGVRQGQTVNAYACMASAITTGAFPGEPVRVSAMQSAVAGQCTACSASALGRTTVDEAKLPNNGLFLAEAISESLSGVIQNDQGCSVLPIICPTGQVALIHIILRNRDGDFGVYDAEIQDPRRISLDCNSQGKWLVPFTNGKQHIGLEVDRYSCIRSTGIGR